MPQKSPDSSLSQCLVKVEKAEHPRHRKQLEQVRRQDSKEHTWEDASSQDSASGPCWGGVGGESEK